MRAAIKLFVLALVVFAAAFATRRMFFWDVVPVPWEQEPQPTWALQAAFLLSTVENVAIIVAALVLAAALARAVGHWWKAKRTAR